MMVTKEIYQLLKTWCDGLISYQVSEIQDRNLKGGILCPACSLIHGRCGNAIPAMLFMAEQEKEEKYIRCAEGLIDWSEQLLCPDGGFVNDTESEWKGITTFAFISLCDAYFHYRQVLSWEYQQKLYKQVTATLDYLVNAFDYHSGNINYMMAQACALDKAGICFREPAYREKAKEIFEEFLHYFTENMLIYGEGAHQWEAVSKTGCRPVDIGYSVEEILNHLVLYGVSSDNEKVLELAQKSAESYLHFFLPDGGWDNSFGTRMDKWTYWGSRTSDGCQPAFFILGKRNPELAYAAYRNMQYLKQCTHDGLLYGGRDVKKHGEPPCVHHTFTHVNGLLTALEWLKEHPVDDVNVGVRPICESKYFPELNVYIHQKDGFRATISGMDLVTEKENCTPRGGALTLLYHEKAGLLCASSMTVYQRYELQNTQRHRDDLDTPLTPRLECRDGKRMFSNLQNLNAKVEKQAENIYFCEGCICDETGAEPLEETIRYTIRYTFLQDELQIEYTHTDEALRLQFHFPLIKEQGVDIQCSEAWTRKDKPVFNHVPGFEATDYYMEQAPQKFTVRIKIKGEAE